MDSRQDYQEYEEGDQFGLPLDGGGFGCGIVARKEQKPGRGLKYVYLYGFGRVWDHMPSFEEAAQFRITDVVTFAAAEGDAAITTGKVIGGSIHASTAPFQRWPILGRMPGFSHETWPLPTILTTTKLGWFDDAFPDSEYIDRAIISKSDEPYFDFPYYGVYDTALEKHIPMGMKHPSDPQWAIRITEAHLAKWREYRPKIRAALEALRAKTRQQRAEAGTGRRKGDGGREGQPPSGFWELIAAAGRRAGADEDRFLESVRDLLLQCPGPAIAKFQKQLFMELNRANSWDLWGAAYLLNGGCSDDGFLYFREWLIAQGKEIFEGALRDPDSLAKARLRYGEPGEYELEGLHSAATDAYHESTDEFLEDDVPEYSKPRGRRWREDSDDLRHRLPALWRKFGKQLGSGKQ